MSRAASNLGRTFAISVKRFTALAVATRAVSLFTNTLSNAVNEAIDFERQLIKVAQVTGQTIGELRFLTKSITDLSTGLGVSSKDLLNTSQLLLQAGVSARDTEVALKTLAKAALAPNFDSLSETTEGAIAILAQFQEGVGSLEGQLSSINAVAGAFAVEAGDLIDVIRRTGGVFKASGGSLNELIALFTSVRATTRESAESIGTGLRTIFTRIQRPKTIEFLKQFGVELVDLEGKFVGPFEAVRRLSEALTGLGERDITFIRIAEELGGFRQIGKVLPLLQQFKTSQEALNVAQKAGTGLTKDAETAQQALAVRITKVQEEFLALVRAITETSSFQFFANTTLNLASALIKLADALKPIIPLLTAVATIKLARGLSSFVGGFGRGIGSGRTFNKGGKVLGFARGGMVPGTGNRDTVPAMLQPGEFVIRKSSVNKLGAGNLAAMNQNRYAKGGKINIKPGAIGGFFLQPEEGIDRKGVSVNQMVQVRGVKALNALGAIDPNDPKLRAETFESATIAQQAKILGVKKLNSKVPNKVSIGGGKKRNTFTPDGEFAKGIGLNADEQANNRLTKRITSGKIKLSKDSKFAKNVELSGNITSYFPGGSDMKKNSDVANIVSQATSNALSQAVKVAANQTKSIFANNRSIRPTDAGIDSASQRIATDSNATKTTEGFVFEGLIQGITGAQLAGGQSNFDFPAESIRNSRKSLQAMFTDSSGEGMDSLIKADAKRTNTPDNIESIVNKLVNDINKGNLLGVNFEKFASGGRAKGILPRPSAINDIIKSGGGYVDIDRTLLRTVGDIAYGKARTEQEKQAVLQKYFLDPVARLKDIKSVGLTQFGKQLQTSIKSGQIQGSRLRVLSKSTEVPGVRSYLSGLFGIPPGNMRFTAGGSKVPFMRNRGPLVDDITSNARFASGGSVGTDTVPALLTPGEFVVNKKSAQSIGYGTLGRMNKVGKYAKGGVVQKFATGGQAQGNGGNLFGGIGSQLTLVTASLQALIPPIDENSSATAKLTNNFLSLATTVGGAIFALEAFGLTINKELIGKVFKSLGSGKGGLGDIIGGFQRQGGKTTRTTGESIGEAFSISKERSKRAKDLLAARSARKSSPFQLGSSRDWLDQLKQETTDLNLRRAKPTSLTGKLGQSLGRNETFVKASELAQSASTKLRKGTTKARDFLGQLPGSDIDIGDIFGRFKKGVNLGSTGQFSLKNIISGQGGNGGIAGRLGGVVGRGAGAIGGAVSRGAGLAGNVLSRIPGAGTVGRFAGRASGAIGGAISGVASGGIGGVVSSLTALAGPLTAIVGSATLVSGAFNAVVSSLYDYDTQLKKATEKGDVQKAGEIAGKQYDLEAANSLRTGGAFVGAAIGTFFGGPIGSAIGAAIGTGLGTLIANLPFGDKISEFVNVLFGGKTKESTIALAQAQAQLVKTSQELQKAEKTTADSIKEFEDGTINAADAMQRVMVATASAETLRQSTQTAVNKNLENKSTGFGAGVRNTLALGGLNPFYETAGARNTKIDEENAKLVAGQQEQILKANQLRTQAGLATARPEILSAISQGKTPEQVKESLIPQKKVLDDIRKQALETRQQAFSAEKRGDTETASKLKEQADALREQANDYEKSIDNLIKEQTRLEKSLKALDLGLRGPTATASAAAAQLEYFASQIEGTALPAVGALGLLEASFTSAGNALDRTSLAEATNSVVQTLQEVGATASSIDKFKNTTESLNTVQSRYASVAAEIAAEQKKSGKALSAEQVRDKFAEKLGEGMPDEIKDLINGIELTDEIKNQIARGDYSGIGDAIGEQGKKLLEPIQKIVQDYQKANQVVIDLTKKRIDAERNYVASIKEAQDIIMEGREIQAKYGGAAVTQEERRGSILKSANAANRLTGLNELRTGSAAELNARSKQINAAFAQNQRRIAGGEGAGKAGGEQLRQQQEDLKNAQKQQVETIRSLIKLEEENLRLIGEKNKLEKDSVDALVSGDIDKFFEQQAAAGAQAAIALGSERLQGAFGANALGAAAQDIKRQQEAGQQTLFGQQLAGPGGLTERAFGAAIGARGITDPRLAQVAAGTTAEESAAQARLRDLGGALGEAGQLGADLAQMEVAQATMNVQQAEIKLQEVIDRGKQASAQAEQEMGQAVGRRLGGLIYANRGIFVPRGTDTVPAMLTPGEFVVRREAVQRGNNLQMLQAMNRGSTTGQSSIGGAIGMANGGVVNQTQYLAFGGFAKAINGLLDGDFINKLSQTFNSFMSDMSKNIDKLNSTNFNIKLDTTNINVNLNGGTFLSQMTEQVRSAVIQEVSKEIQNYSAGEGGRLRKNSGIVNKG
ncbi:phage tail tape measure protein [bacterium]|nr:phage tail tape measure protein [bacterium]